MSIPFNIASHISAPSSSTALLTQTFGPPPTELSYWKSYKNPIYIRLPKSASGFTPPTSISFSPSDMRSFAISQGTRVGIYGRKGGELSSKAMRANTKKATKGKKRRKDDYDDFDEGER